MQVERETTLYEILLRFGPDGLQGAHVIDRERLIDRDTGDVLKDETGKARAVTAAEVGVYLGAKNAALLEAVAVAEARVAELDQALAEQKAAIEPERAARKAAERKLAAIVELLASEDSTARA